MADLAFLCPKCGEQLRAPAGAAGRTVTCHVCGEDMRVPSAAPGTGSLPRGEMLGGPAAPANPPAPTSVRAEAPRAEPPRVSLPPPLPPPLPRSVSRSAAGTAQPPGRVAVPVVILVGAVVLLLGFCVVVGVGVVGWSLWKSPERPPAIAKGPTKDKEPTKGPSEPAPNKKPADAGPPKDGVKPGDIAPPVKDAASKDVANPPIAKDQTKRLISDQEITERVTKAGGKIGKVTVSLAWLNYNDLDLHVVTASGEKIFYANRLSQCGGQLDVDQNVFPTTTTPVENIYWPANSPPRGPFKIYVHHYMRHNRPGCQDPTRFVVRVQIDDSVQTFEGSVSFSGGRLAYVAEIAVPVSGK